MRSISVLLLEGGVLERVGEDVEGRQEGRKEGRKRERGERRNVESMFASCAVYSCLVRRHVCTVAHLSTVLALAAQNYSQFLQRRKF